MLTPAELVDLLVTMLAGATSKPEAHWRDRIEIKWTSLALNPHSNWKIEATGTLTDKDAIARAVELLREAEPYVRWPTD